MEYDLDFLIIIGWININSIQLDKSTNLDANNLDGAVGEAALDGFFVISGSANGSGSANTSTLNNGTGQDGVVGKTYRDAVTGLTFTILPRGWSTDEDGPWLAYPTGANAVFRITVSPTFTCDANIPMTALNGVETKVSNTTGITVGDTATVTTYERGGQEPSTGDVYYVSYTFQKQDYTTTFFTKMAAIEAAYGEVHPDNPLSLASWLSMKNGAVLLGLKQVPRATDSNFAALTSYTAAITELEGVLPGQVLPDIITPLRGESTDLFQILSKSNGIMSSIRYRSERTSIIGVSGGTTPAEVRTLARTLANTRMRVVYPDTALINLIDYAGNSKEHLIDGPMLAAGLVGSVVSPNVDVATPWTGKTLTGYVQLGRQLDPVQQNQIAQDGVTILEEKPPFLRVRHGLSTDLTSILTKVPTVIMIADEVQRLSRVVLSGFIGIKFLPGILSQVEGRLAMMFKALVRGEIVAAYTGIKAQASEDPTSASLNAYYAPIFPLLYLILTFHLRTSVSSS